MYVQSNAGNEGKGKDKSPVTDEFLLHCEPVARANSFVGTEEYLAPEVINASGHAAGEHALWSCSDVKPGQAWCAYA